MDYGWNKRVGRRSPTQVTAGRKRRGAQRRPCVTGILPAPSHPHLLAHPCGACVWWLTQGSMI